LHPVINAGVEVSQDSVDGVWADTGISTGQVADEDAPVGRVILDWTDERIDVRRSLGMHCVPGQAQMAG